MDYPGEKLLGKMWDTLVDKGVGKLVQPWQTRREGRAQADVTLFLAQAEKDANDIRAGKKVLSGAGSTVRLIEASANALPAIEMGDGRKEPSLNLEFVVQSATSAQVAQVVREEVNVARAVLHAQAILAEDSCPPPEATVDEDWLYRWREEAARVSSEKMQSLWGRVLAGEVRSPGSFSLRTLDFLKNLSQEEAQQIETFSRYVYDGGVVPRYGVVEDMREKGRDVRLLLSMEELGLVLGTTGTGLTWTLPSIEEDCFRLTLAGGNKGLLVQNADASKQLALRIFRATALGTEVFSLANQNVDDAHFMSIADACHKQGFSVGMFDVVNDPESDEGYILENVVPLFESLNG